jgi:putative ABC transport system ATP-binding protein
MNILGCLDIPDAGEYMFEGRKVNGLSGSALADLRNRRIGFIFQSFNLLSRYNIYANVELPLIYSGLDAKERKARVHRAVESVGLEDRLKHRPSELSGGQRQRVAIARALVNDPALILADEPTGNLDSATGREIMELFRDLVGRGRTVLVVTHDPVIAQSAQGLIEIRDGRIVRNEGLTVEPSGEVVR